MNPKRTKRCGSPTILEDCLRYGTNMSELELKWTLVKLRRIAISLERRTWAVPPQVRHSSLRVQMAHWPALRNITKRRNQRRKLALYATTGSRQFTTSCTVVACCSPLPKPEVVMCKFLQAYPCFLCAPSWLRLVWSSPGLFPVRQ
jgi:hypothetical protein